jgi:hypothetical protein
MQFNISMKQIHILILIMFSGNLAVSQLTYEKEIVWNPISQQEINGEQYFTIAPVNVNFVVDHTYLPVIHESIIPGSHFTKAEARIVESRFQELTADESARLDGLKSVGSELQINLSTQYIRKKPGIEIHYLPFRKNPSNGKYEKLSYLKLSISIKSETQAIARTQKTVSSSVLGTGKWVKVAVDKDGIYKLTFDDLTGMGFSNPAQVKVFGNLGGMLPMQNSIASWDDLNELAIQRNSDHILFYARGPHKWNYKESYEMFIQENHLYSTKSYYYLSEDVGSGRNLTELTQASSSHNYTSQFFDDYAFYEPEDTNLIKSGREWYGDEFNVLESRDYEFNFPNLAAGNNIKAQTAVIARSSLTSSFTVSANNTVVESLAGITEVSFGENNTFAYGKVSTVEFASGNDNITMTLTYNKPVSSAKGWLNYLTLNARRKLRYAGSQMIFRDIESVLMGRVTQFEITNAGTSVQLWEVTDPLNVRKVSPSIQGSVASFKAETDSLREFVAFNGTGFYSPEIIGDVPNQNIHGHDIPEMVIIAPARFLMYANEIKDLHEEHDDLSVLLVSNEQVFNEFSSGMPDVSAFRNMMRMFYKRAVTEDEVPKYLLLFGDGSYNNKTSTGNIDQIMTYQTSNSLNPISSICTDDFYGYLDDNEGDITGKVDVGIGRIPVSTDAQARNAVDKLKHYYSSSTYGDWRNIVSFIGDDPDSPNYNVHTELSEDICQFIAVEYPSFNVDKIYLDAFPQESTASGERYPDAEIAINNRINKGALLMNYAGHGNEIGLSHERVITVDDILGWENYDRLPMFVTATCEFTRFDDYGRTSGGELIFLNNNGGGIALMTTSRSVFHSSLNKNFYDFALSKDDDSKYRTIGNIVMETKNKSGGSGDTNTKKFVLIGDPALRLALPEYSVKTDSINGQSVFESTDTLRALSYVRISGHMEDGLGNIMNDFNGTIFPTIYDKVKIMYTLGNEGNAPFPYDAQTNIIYKGKASVDSGYFSYNFIVPKDISYDFGHGKLSYYANNEEIDASGFSRNVIIGGTSNSGYTDDEGPEIELYINNEEFIYGGMTNETPTILAYLKDKSGINTVGNGIGHDISVVMDNNANNNLVLNDYYEADINSYKSGRLEYKLSGLSSGEHFLKLKVWDILNNSSIDSIAFFVEESAEMAIDRLFNYPNPFTERTSFYFEHNQSNTSLDIQIQIFTISGKLVKTLETNLFADGYRIGPIDWDGTDDFGNKIGRGVYVYKMKMINEKGQKVDKIEKLVVLK